MMMMKLSNTPLTVFAATSGNLVIQVQHGFSLKKNRMMQHRAQ